ncbi:MAG: penicillin-binding protein 2 [Gallionellaceae bacterium]|jgi:penicillin-binding protein 2|nr:penicillin-binding protein 2 [Gallionellaceae bacterium]
MKRRVEFRNSQREIHQFRLRLAVGIGFVLVLLFTLTTRFFYLQVLKHSHFQTMAENNRISVVPTVPNRGLILDRNGVQLARNYSGYTLEITPSKVPDLNATLEEISRLVDVQPKDRKRFKKQLEESRNFESLVIRSQLSDEEVARFAAQSYRFPGVEIKARLFREYPLEEVTSHLIGYIGRINEADMARLNENDEVAANYRGSDHIGKVGLEQSYESELHGVSGIEQVEVDAGGRGVRTLSHVPPVAGDDLVLSIDAQLQQIADQAFGAYRGALVAIDPNNGEVLAFVSRPGYDPNLFIDGIDEDSWEELNNSPDVPLNNRALRGQYPPGSTIKPFMALAGLFYKKRTPADTISDPGYFTLSGSTHRYRDWKKEGHGVVDMFKSIVVSCDTYYYRLAVDLGIDNIHGFLSQFGFGSKTGVDLQGEQPGLLPSSEWKTKRYKQKWFAGDTVSVGIGQGYNLVTPMQLAYATAILANGGAGYRPHLVRALRHNGVEKPVAPELDVNVNIDPGHLDLVRRAMVAVTQPGGTAVVASLGAEYAIAGKTGTAQVIGIKQGEKYDADKLNERHRDHAWFIAFAPADKPKIALAVLVENGGHGGSVAAPIARSVFDYYLLGKTPKTVAAAAPPEEPGDAGEEHD